mgnify:CR=1 FL=1|tara:strand:- start:4312 stop:5451 length:1140 start_codon:yes stop_codon:yes gene_type:complete
MLDKLPSEILLIIIHKACKGPGDYITLRNVNQELFTMIDRKEHLFYTFSPESIDYSNKINGFCKKKTNLKTFDWFFKNDVQFTLENIKQLIINNRIDVFKRGFFYEYFLKLIFNRFYIDVGINDDVSDIFSIITTNNPLIIAGIHNKVEIIKLLLEKSSHGNPYLKMINALLDISIKHNHKNLLSYLIINYYENETNNNLNIECKLIKIIHRVKNCEDILFFLHTKGIRVESKHLPGLIMMGYNDFFTIQYRTIFHKSDIKFKLNLLSYTVSYNNIDLFNRIFTNIRDDLTKDEIQGTIFQNTKITSNFLYNMINNHKEYISKDLSIISTCIRSHVTDNTIIDLVNEGYSFNKEDMEIILKNGKINILLCMCNKYDKLN